MGDLWFIFLSSHSLETHDQNPWLPPDCYLVPQTLGSQIFRSRLAEFNRGTSKWPKGRMLLFVEDLDGSVRSFWRNCQSGANQIFSLGYKGLTGDGNSSPRFT